MIHKALIVEDNPADAYLLLQELKKTDLELTSMVVEKESDFRNALVDFKPDIVMSDFFLNEFTGIKALHIVKKYNPELPFIMVTGSIDEETAVQCMKNGADDYITKGHYYRIPTAVTSAIDRKKDREEKRAVIDKLNESEEQFRNLFNNMAIGFFRISSEGDILLLNPAFVKMLGYKSFDELQIHKYDYLSSLLKSLFIEDKVIQGAEIEFHDINGDIVYVRITAKALYKDEKIFCYEGTAEDITYLKRSENAFAEQDKLYKVIFDQSVNGIFLVNHITGSILDSNRAFQDIVNYDKEELNSLRISDLMDGHIDSTRAPGEAVDLAGNYSGEKKCKRKDGVLITVFVSVSPLFYKEKQILCLIVKDITRQKEIEAELEKSSHFLRQVLDTLPNDLFIFKYETGKLLYVNSKNSLGYEAEELRKLKSCRLLVHSEDVDNLIEHTKKLYSAEENTVVEIECRMKNKSGVYSWYSIHETVFLKNKSGKAEEILGIATCISDRKEILEEFKIAKEKAEEASKAKSDFLANISHEIRTPLNGIIGLTNLLYATDLNQKQREYADLIKLSSNNLFALINDILDLSKIESGTIKLKQDIVDVYELVGETIKFFEIEAKKKNIKLEAEVDQKIRYNLMTDHTRIKQVVFNLLSNALKFTEKGSVKILVKEIFKESSNAIIAISVSDTGIGIEKEKTQMLFERFTQLDSSYNKKYQGSGLGLTIVKGIVDMFSGKIFVDSKLNQGTTFTCEIPFLVTLRPTKSLEKSAMPKLSDIAAEKNILLADDDFVNQLYIKTILKEHNINVTIVKNGKEALEKIMDEVFDLVLMDGQMPEMDGFETTKKIRGIEKNTGLHIPVIALTAYALNEEKQKCFECGMDDFVSKPIDEYLLLSTIEKYLNNKINQRENV